MWRIGFGLERLGLLALRFPKLFTFLLFALSVFSTLNIVKLQFDGNVTVVLPESSPTYENYYALQDEYRNFSRDITVMVKGDDIASAKGLETLREIQFEISLTDGVANTTSILSLPDFDPVTGELRDWFPQDFPGDSESKALITSLLDKYPQAKSLFSVEENTAVIFASQDFGVQDDDDKSFASYYELRKAALAAAPEGYEIYFTGLTPVGATIVQAIFSDQVNLTILGLIFGAAIAFYIFRSFLAALICAVSPAFTAFWALGVFSYFQIPVNYLTTVLPTLALILAFADGIFLYFRWQALNVENPDMRQNLETAIKRVGPASSLTSLTTALAFLSFLYVGSDALDQFAYLGAASVMLGFVGVIIGMPIFVHWLLQFNLIPTSLSKPPMFLSIGKKIRKIPLKFPVIVSAVSLLIVIAMSLVHNKIVPEYKITDYLPKDAEVYKSEILANKIVGGRSLLLLSIPLKPNSNISDPENVERAKIVEDILNELYHESRIFSASRLIDTLKTKEARARIEQMLLEAPESSRTDFLSASGNSMLISVRLSSEASAAEVSDQHQYILQRLNKHSFAKDTVITGFPILMSIEFTKLIDQLRWSLLLAICMGILFVGIATRSPFITLAAILPNLFPIFFVQFMIYLRGGTINMSEVVALTVAFGIAIDNSVHLINVYDFEKRSGKGNFHALSSALEDCAPALSAGTVIICAACFVTQFSSMPTVPVIGQLIVATLIAALFANLLIFPAKILTLEYFTQNWLNGKKNRE